MAKANPLRFSTKYQDDESDLLYYGQRCYNACIGSWITRDPVQERGGRNLYAFLGNSPVSRVDVLGLGDFLWTRTQYVDGNEIDGPYTVWLDFDPEAEVFSNSGCCWRVRLSGGQAGSISYILPGGGHGQTIFEHERYHVEHHLKPAFNDYKAAAAQLGAPCMTKTKAMCLKDVILNQLKSEYIMRSYRDTAVWDYEGYGPYPWPPGGQAAAKAAMDEGIEEYDLAQAATSAGVAACTALGN